MEFHKQKQQGFTLVEILVAVSIAAIALALAAPGFQSMIEKNRVAHSTNTFLSHLHSARAEAIKQGERVMLCPSSDGRSCITDFRGWGEGYIVFVDSDHDRERGDDERVLGHFQGEERGVVIQTSSSHRDVIGYRASGRAWGFNTTVRFCSEKEPKYNKTVVISSTGRPRVSNSMTDGSAVSCA